MKPTLLILAAGIGSRYGGVKQLDKFGPHDETIIDYSLYDAVRSGFGKVVFIVREEIVNDVDAIFGPKLKGSIEYDFAIQGIQSYVPKELGEVDRKKPWGTGHAMLCAWEQTKTPFAVINADDFYGKESFDKMANFLRSDADPSLHSMIAYELGRTLSENGTVSRGVCEVFSNDNLAVVTERTKIYPQGDEIFYEENGEKIPLAADTPVSMNFWGFKESIFSIVKSMFEEYARQNFAAPKAEFYIPLIVTNVIAGGMGKCRVFRSSSDWFGVTYPEDKPQVQKRLSDLHLNGKYPDKLWK